MSVLNDLKATIDSKKEEDISRSLTKILAQGTDIELTDKELINNLLKLNFQTDNITTLAVQVIAEWAKSEQNRLILTDTEIISALSLLLHHKNEDIVVQAIRALGNICYENENGCNIIEKCGIERLLDILKKDSERRNNLLTTKASGFLLNLLSTHEGLPKTVIQNDVMNILEVLLTKYKRTLNENQMLVAFLLSILNTVADYLDEQNITFSESICNVVIDICKSSTVPEISVTCVEILHGQSEKDEIKMLLASQGICELLFELIEKYRHRVNDEESRSVLKMACDLIVIILTGDDCMNLLYNNGNGTVYKNMTKWLDSDDLDLLSTGVLAIGNFARKDLHCEQMAKNGLSKKLIDLLSKYNSTESDIKIQHALLSTLKNLVIPQPNKEIVLKEGLLDVIYPMIKTDQYLVVFKLLGLFRMVIDGQESAAMDLVCRIDFLERIVYWCYNSDHLGVRGEVPRLLSWLIKNCHSFKPFKNLLEVTDSVKCLVEMISSNHAVMENEAFYAINLLCIGCSHSSDSTENGDLVNGDDCESECKKLYDILISSEIGKNLHFVLNKYGDKMDAQTIDNLLTLFEHLLKSKSIVEHLNSVDISDALKKLLTNINVSNSGRVNNILSELNKT